jgi:RHH-type rel operon transcriptional repressor/antitoxin RelB
LAAFCITAHYPVLFVTVAQKTISFRLENKKKKALDAIATALDRDRSYVLNEAIDAYLEVHRWQIAHIEDGIRQANAGKFATTREVAAAFARWRK